MKPANLTEFKEKKGVSGREMARLSGSGSIIPLMPMNTRPFPGGVIITKIHRLFTPREEGEKGKITPLLPYRGDCLSLGRSPE